MAFANPEGACPLRIGATALNWGFFNYPFWGDYGCHSYGERDGRGNLSEAALKTFCEWFLKVALDQISFSAKLFDLGGLDKRYRRLVEDTIDDKRAPDLISAVLRHGALERGDAQIVLKTSERTARNTLSKLTAAGYLASASPKTPVRLAFPLDYRERLFPNLFADADLPK